MPQIIRLPEPFHEDWNKMTPNERGRHCAQCDKTVVDFTGWQPIEILFYLKVNAGSCGRFRQDQLNVPLPSPEDFVQHIVHLPLAFIKKIAAIFLFVFGLMSCTSEPKQGTSALIRANPIEQNPIKPADTLPVPTVSTDPMMNVEPNDPVGENTIVEPMDYPVMGGAPIMEQVPLIDSSTLRPKPLPAPYQDSL